MLKPMTPFALLLPIKSSYFGPAHQTISNLSARSTVQYLRTLIIPLEIGPSDRSSLGITSVIQVQPYNSQRYASDCTRRLIFDERFFMRGDVLPSHLLVRPSRSSDGGGAVRRKRFDVVPPGLVCKCERIKRHPKSSVAPVVGDFSTRRAFCRSHYRGLTPPNVQLRPKLVFLATTVPATTRL